MPYCARDDQITGRGINLDWNAETKDKNNALGLAIDANEHPNPNVFPHVEAFLVSLIAIS